MGKGKQKVAPLEAGATARKARLAEALKANLKRRKAQERARRDIPKKTD